MEARPSAGCAASATSSADTSAAVVTAITGSRRLHGAGQGRRGGERDFEGFEGAFLGRHAANLVAFGHGDRDAEDGGAGRERRGGVEQRGGQFVERARVADAAHRLVQLIGQFAAGAAAGLVEQALHFVDNCESCPSSIWRSGEAEPGNPFLRLF